MTASRTSVHRTAGLCFIAFLRVGVGAGAVALGTAGWPLECSEGHGGVAFAPVNNAELGVRGVGDRNAWWRLVLIKGFVFFRYDPLFVCGVVVLRNVRRQWIIFWDVLV